MKLNKVFLLVSAILFCALLFGCAATTEQSAAMVVQSAARPGPVVQAPVYKDGDWWKVKMEQKGGSGFRCSSEYSKYLLEIQKSKPKLYGISGTNKEEFYCPGVVDEILGKTTRKLKFPLRVGNRWAHRYLREGLERNRLVKVEYKVLGWQKVQTPKGMFETFKLSSYVTFLKNELTETYYYSPKVKAIILRKYNNLRSGKLRVDRTHTVVDFNVSN